jgi:hypothetical protein
VNPPRSAQAAAPLIKDQTPMSNPEIVSCEEINDISKTFLALPKYISVESHPSQPNTSAIRLKFISNLNVAPALAAFLNQEFYKMPRDSGRINSFSRNAFAFVEENQKEQFLFVTIDGPLAPFIDRLRPFSTALHDIVKHPAVQLFPESPNAQHAGLALQI